MKLAGKRMQLQTIIYSEIIQIKKDKQLVSDVYVLFRISFQGEKTDSVGIMVNKLWEKKNKGSY